MKNKFLLMGLVAMVLTSTLAIADSKDGKKTKDARLDEVLNNTGLNYYVNDSGDAKITLNGFDGERSQLVVVNANTNITSEIEVRDVWSIADILSTPLSEENMKFLLEKNANYKLGAWGVKKEGDKYIVIFTVTIPANADKKILAASISAAATTADKIELKLNGKDDR